MVLDSAFVVCSGRAQRRARAADQARHHHRPGPADGRAGCLRRRPRGDRLTPIRPVSPPGQSPAPFGHFPGTFPDRDRSGFVDDVRAGGESRAGAASGDNGQTVTHRARPGRRRQVGGRKNEADPGHRRRRFHRLPLGRPSARARLYRPGARQPLPADARRRAERPAYLAPEVELVAATSATRSPRAARWTASTRWSISPRGRRRPEHVRGRPTTSRVNERGTAVLLEALIEQAPVRAARRRLQHEHLWRGPLPRRPTAARSRTPSAAPQLEAPATGSPLDRNGRPLEPVPTPGDEAPGAGVGLCAVEIRPGAPAASSLGQAYGMPTRRAAASSTSTGRGQALSNPYTGVLAIFAVAPAQRPAADDLRGRRAAARLRLCRRCRRSACRLALERARRAGEVFNIGSGEAAHGRARSPRLLARAMGAATSRRRSPASTGSAISATASPTSRRRATMLGFEPRRTSTQGLAELAELARRAGGAIDRVARGARASSKRGD